MSTVFSSDECVICLGESATITFIPCMHRCTCKTCADQVKSANLFCPLCRGTIETMQEHCEAALLPSRKELDSFDRDEYKRLLTRSHTKNACFTGKSKQARAVSRHVGNEMEQRQLENAGTDRYGGKDYTFTVDGDLFTVTYKVKGKRKPLIETYAFIRSWEEVLEQLPTPEDPMEIATYYPEFFWLAKYYKQSLPETNKRRK
jgi:hypothetical protein